MNVLHLLSAVNKQVVKLLIKVKGAVEEATESGLVMSKFLTAK